MMNEKPMWKTEEKHLEKCDENQGVAVSCELVEERLTCPRGWSPVSEAMGEKVPEIRKKEKILIIFQFNWISEEQDSSHYWLGEKAIGRKKMLEDSIICDPLE